MVREVVPRALAIHTFTRSIATTFPLTNPVTGVANYAWAFKLSDLPNYSEFVNLFDAYRIKSVHLKFVPSWDSSNKTQPPNADTLMPTLVTVMDHNDALALNSRADYMQYTSYKESALTANSPVSIIVNPTPAVAVYGGGVFASYGQNQGVWVDTGSYTVEHYGLKWAVIWPVAGTGNLGGYVTVFQTYTLECKDTR